MLTDLTDSIAIKRAIEKVVDERIAQITKECLRTYKAQIVSKTSTKMNVRLIGDISSAISVPYSTAVANSCSTPVSWNSVIFERTSGSIHRFLGLVRSTI